MRNWIRRVFVGLLVVALLVPAVALAADNPATVGYYTWELVGASYDSVTNTTTYTYTVTGPGPGSSVIQDLSHWTMDICDNLAVVGGTPNPELVLVGPDPATGIAWGVKWDMLQDTEATVTYTLTVEGETATGDVPIVYKASTSTFSGTILGPTCDALPPVGSNATFTVLKFYDTNGNQVQDLDEPFIEGWEMTLSDSPATLYITMATDSTGTVEFGNLDESTYYEVNEAYGGMPGTGNAYTVWENTMPLVAGPFLGDEDQTVIFGNRCLYVGLGRTIGYWSNKNGQNDTTDTLFADLLAFADWYNEGSLTEKSELPGYLLGASAGKKGSMYYMLSAQMMATWLNVNSGKLPGDAMVDTPDGFMTVEAALVAATAYLNGSADKAVQGEWKDLFDSINNNTATVVAPPGECEPVYAE